MALPSVYLDYQASAPLDPAVLEAMKQVYGAPGNPSAEEHSFGWSARSRVEVARVQVADLINADPSEVYFTSGASEANNIAILGGSRAAPTSRRRILVSTIEHKSVSGPAIALEREGFRTEFIPVGSDGLINLDALASRVGDDVAMISVMAVNNEIGTIQPTRAVVALGRAAGAFVHVDATQALAAVPVDLPGWGADSLAISAHKICGPPGVGALVVAGEAPWRPAAISFGGGQEGGLRPGTIPAALCVGLGVACERVSVTGAEERQRIADLKEQLSDGLQVKGVVFTVTAEASARHPGCFHVRLPGVDAADILTRLQPRLAASTGSACTSGLIGPSEVLLALGMRPEEAAQCVRFSLGRFTTAEEIDLAVGWITDAVEAQLRLS